MDQSIFNIIIGVAGFFGAYILNGIKDTMNEVKQRQHELTYEISSVRENYLTREDLTKLFKLYLDPIDKTLTEIKEDLKNKQDKG